MNRFWPLKFVHAETVLSPLGCGPEMLFVQSVLVPSGWILCNSEHGVHFVSSNECAESDDLEPEVSHPPLPLRVQPCGFRSGAQEGEKAVPIKRASEKVAVRERKTLLRVFGPKVPCFPWSARKGLAK